jgi:hypothetical protein
METSPKNCGLLGGNGNTLKRQKNIDCHGPNVSPSWPLQLIWFYILTNMFCVLYTEIVRCVEAKSMRVKEQ